MGSLEKLADENGIIALVGLFGTIVQLDLGSSDPVTLPA